MRALSEKSSSPSLMGPGSSSDSSTSSPVGMMTFFLKRRKPTWRRSGRRLERADLRTGGSGDAGAGERAERREGAEEEEDDDILPL